MEMTVENYRDKDDIHVPTFLTFQAYYIYLCSISVVIGAPATSLNIFREAYYV